MSNPQNESEPFKTIYVNERNYLVEPIFNVFGTNGRKLFSVNRDNVDYVMRAWGWSFSQIKTKSGKFQITDFVVIENQSQGRAKIDLFVEPAS